MCETNLVSELKFENSGFKLKFYYNALRKFYCRVINEKEEQILPILGESQIFWECQTTLKKLNKFSSAEKFDIVVSNAIRKARIAPEGLYLTNSVDAGVK